MSTELARRDFLARLAGGVAAASLAPATALGATERVRPRLPHLSLVGEDEAYWKAVRDQFPLRAGFIYLNAANLAPSPYLVSDTVADLTREIDREMSQQNRGKFSGLREYARTALAQHLGADPDEIAITRNTTEGNNTVVNGINLGPGDEVVIWDQNHPTNNVAWEVRAERYGFTVKKVKTPPAAAQPSDLAAPFLAALTPRTKVLSITHISSSSGVALPARELCAAARQRGILTLLDGAQSFGSVVVNLRDIGCDFYAGSAHKWFMGPRETGVLFVRKERQAALWPQMVGIGWQSAKDHGARKFETLGQRDDGAVSALGKAADFHATIGRERIDARVRELATRLKSGLQQRVPGIKFHTPVDSSMSAGIVIFALPKMDNAEGAKVLYEKNQITCAVSGGDFAGLRFAPHIYVSMQDIDKAVDAVVSLAANPPVAAAKAG
ncbi:MAG: aminotransferase class V-fold PLP-dependent enzyme [Gemmatimonadetes bacterium]|nr:aminotransferase class V-fold PLP-dependent enzyme [Gemmatimonadota bacterium]